MELECQRYRDDLALLALDDPDFQPTAALLAHVDRCPSCRGFLRHSRESLGGLLLEEATAPPPDLKVRVMEALCAEGGGAPAGPATSAGQVRHAGLSSSDGYLRGGAAALRTTAGPEPPSTPPGGDAPRRRGLFARWGRWRAAAILLLLASLAANGRLVLETWKPGGSHSQDALVAQLEALQEVLFAPEYVAPRVFALEGAGSDPAGKVAFCRVSDGSFYVMVASRGWPPDAPDQGYHLWLQAGDQVIDGGRLTFTGDRGLAVLELPEPIPVQAVRLGTGQGSPMLWTQVDDPWPAPRETW